MAGLMIAEDELIERMVLKKMLQKKFGEQCTIYEAQNGHEAVELARREEIQVINLDIGMPGMNGIQAAKIIRREHPECCIIFLTAYDRFEYARSAISVGAMEYLLKPYSSREIIHVTGEALHLADRYRTWRAGKNGAGGDGAGGDRAGGAGAEAAAGKDGAGGTGAGETASGEILPFTLRLVDEPDQEKENDESCTRLSLMVSMVEEYIRTHYMYEISMHDAAKAVNYSDPYFCKMFKQQFGQNFTSYLAEYRINEAKKLLCRPNVNVKDVGIRVGYPDNNYFTKVFRRLAGMNPSDYRMELLQKL